MAKQGVLLLAHGTPETVEQIPEYLRNVVSGRPLPEHVIEEIQHRYSLIGRSPLTEITLEQGRLVEAELAMEGPPVQVYVGMRNWKPYIPDVVREMRADGVEEAAVDLHGAAELTHQRGALQTSGAGRGGRAADRLHRRLGTEFAPRRCICGTSARCGGEGQRGNRRAGSSAVYGSQRAYSHG